MAKKGVKIKDLAVELGATSRVLIDRCREAGMTVQNSITRISPNDAARVRAWFASEAQAGSPQETEGLGG